ncbi:conserved membrane hypothetical protein [Planktothrix serta PCC 8927]|uniref:VanZ-like domain-containing protein n=2 Tax=Planktothrix TaxID=54304 RepID=A0A7Z9C207_9CYAN|nr:conserved membrane hypothetical protein [Planktothrix serta PCC 8927]
MLLLIVITADLGNLPYYWLEKLPFYDVYGHFILYGIASVLSHQALGRQKLVIYNIFLPLGPFLFALVTIAEEMMQTLFPSRTFSLLDLSASLIGIIVFYYIGELCYYFYYKNH